jgi:phage gp45-like
MAALTFVPQNPINVCGNTRERVYTIATTVADADTFTVTEFTSVLHAVFVPATNVTGNVALSGTGNRTLTFKMSASATSGGRLFVKGQ